MTLHYECDALTADESYVCITMTHTFRPAIHSNACSCSLIGFISGCSQQLSNQQLPNQQLPNQQLSSRQLSSQQLSTQ